MSVVSHGCVTFWLLDYQDLHLDLRVEKFVSPTCICIFLPLQTLFVRTSEFRLSFH